MAESKRDVKSSRNLVIGVVAILVLVSVGIYFYDGGLNDNEDVTGEVVAVVDGQVITSDAVAVIQQAFLQQGQQLSEEDATEHAINQEVLTQKVRQEGITVTTEEAEGIIEVQLSQQGATLDDYKKQIEAQGIVYQDAIEDIKDQIATQTYLENALEGREVEVTEEEAEEFYEMLKLQSLEEIPPYEEVESQIVVQLQRQKQQELVGSLVQELRADANIEYK